GGGAREVPTPELIDRACRLIPNGATAERVAHVVAVYTAEWVELALDDAEEWNRKAPLKGVSPGQGWGFVLDRLKRWQEEGGAPPKKAGPDPAPATAQSEARRAEKAEQAAHRAREERLKARWGVLPEAEKEAIEASVKDADPAAVRFKGVLLTLCLDEMERRSEPAEKPRAP